MLKKPIAYLSTALMSLLMACNNKGELSFKENENGIKYYFYEDAEGENAKLGEFVTAHFRFKTAKDSVLRDSWKEGSPIQFMVQKPTFKGGLEEILTMVSVGDSLTFRINSDSLFEKTFMAPLPPFIEKGSFVAFDLKVIKIQNKEEFEQDQRRLMEERKKQMEEMMDKQKSIDEELIKKYLDDNKIAATKTASGLYYVINKSGKGNKPKPGSVVTVHYKGSLLDGKVFDSSEGKDPIEFQLGVGQVIPGWDEGIALLNQGSSATLIIPSSLGYGPIPMGDQIPANSILLFDVQLVKVK